MATPTNLPATVSAGSTATSTWANDIRGAFRILQVVSATSTTAWTNSTNTYTDVTGVTVDITPQATASKILIIVSIAGAYKTTGNTSLDLEIRRGTTTIYTAGSNFNTASTATNAGTVTMSYLDSPATNALRTYKVRGRSSANIAAVGATLGGDSTITVFEISA